MDERKLLKKLLLKGHINVIERKALPNGKANRKILIEIIVDELIKAKKFPPQHNLKENFDGGLILCFSNNKIIVYRKAETSFNTYQIISQQEYKDPEQAAEAYLDIAHKNQIDGINIE